MRYAAMSLLTAGTQI